MHGVARLVDRQPSVSPERLVSQLMPPPMFADASFASYHPDPAEPSQAGAVAACQRFCLTGVHAIDDQNVALRLVALTDRLYVAGIPVCAFGEQLAHIFGAEMLARSFRKKYLRATSRLLALSAAVNA